MGNTLASFEYNFPLTFNKYLRFEGGFNSSTVKPFRVALVKPVVYLKTELIQLLLLDGFDQNGPECGQCVSGQIRG